MFHNTTTCANGISRHSQHSKIMWFFQGVCWSNDHGTMAPWHSNVTDLRAARRSLATSPVPSVASRRLADAVPNDCWIVGPWAELFCQFVICWQYIYIYIHVTIIHILFCMQLIYIYIQFIYIYIYTDTTYIYIYIYTTYIYNTTYIYTIYIYIYILIYLQLIYITYIQNFYRTHTCVAQINTSFIYILYIYIVVRKCPSFQPLVDDLKLLKMLICHKVCYFTRGCIWSLLPESSRSHGSCLQVSQLITGWMPFLLVRFCCRRYR